MESESKHRGHRNDITADESRVSSHDFEKKTIWRFSFFDSLEDVNFNFFRNKDSILSAKKKINEKNNEKIVNLFVHEECFKKSSKEGPVVFCSLKQSYL